MAVKKSKVRYFAEIRRSGMHEWKLFSELNTLNAAKLFLSQNSKGIDFVRVTKILDGRVEVFYS